MYKYIQLQCTEDTATLWLDRPHKRNAFNEGMVDELLAVLEHLAREDNLKVLIIRGKGTVFCAGADLNWMKGVINYSVSKNFQESKKLFRLFHHLYTFPFPVVTVVQGACFGGANGLVAASDIVLAASHTRFAFPEVRLGLVPATIAPFVVRRLGQAHARELMLTGKQFDGQAAREYGLVNHAVPEKELERLLESTLKALCAAPASALKSTRKLLEKVEQTPQLEYLEDITAQVIAEARVSLHGQEGMKAFTEKRKPQWENSNHETASHDQQTDQ